jgi:hypothetical protein
MTLRHSEIGPRLFEATYVPVFNVRNAQEDIGQNERLKMRTLHCPETSGYDFRTAQRGIPEERNLPLHWCENLKTGRRSAVVKFILHEISGDVIVLAEFCMGSFKVYFTH